MKLTGNQCPRTRVAQDMSDAVRVRPWLETVEFPTVQLAGLNASLLFLPGTGGYNDSNLSLQIDQRVLQRCGFLDRLFILTLSESCLVFTFLRWISKCDEYTQIPPTYRQLRPLSLHSLL
jgi:hypothetical protein